MVGDGIAFSGDGSLSLTTGPDRRKSKRTQDIEYEQLRLLGNTGTAPSCNQCIDIPSTTSYNPSSLSTQPGPSSL